MICLNMASKVLTAAFLAVALCFTTTGCATSEEGSGSFIPKYENKISGNGTLTLESYLRRLNSVQVSGSGRNLTVSIRGNMASRGISNQPLYVVNDNEVGHSYVKALQLVSRHEISSVEAIPAARAARYGIEGGSGVIVIETL